MADASAIIARLQELGMSEAGARQVMAAEPVGSAADRGALAGILNGVLSAQISPVNLSASAGDALASSTEPGTSKVSTRIIAENFD